MDADIDIDQNLNLYLYLFWSRSLPRPSVGRSEPLETTARRLRSARGRWRATSPVALGCAPPESTPSALVPARPCSGSSDAAPPRDHLPPVISAAFLPAARPVPPARRRCSVLPLSPYPCLHSPFPNTRGTPHPMPLTGASCSHLQRLFRPRPRARSRRCAPRSRRRGPLSTPRRACSHRQSPAC